VTAVWEVQHATADGKAGTTSVRTTADGHFLLIGLPPGPVTLSSAPGAEATVYASLDQEVVVDLALRRPARVSGRVRDASGAPISCDVQYYREDDGDWPAAETRSDSQGEYVLDDLQPGPGLIIARHDESRTPALPLQLDYDSTEVRDLHFSAGRIIGRVTVQGTSEPAAGVRVRAVGLDQAQDQSQSSWSGIGGMMAADLSDDEGRFELRGLEPGRYHLTAGSAAYVMPTTGVVEATLEGAELTHDLSVVPSAVLAGRVSLATGAPAEGRLSLILTRIDAPGERWWGIPFEGDYKVTGIPAGHYGYEAKSNTHSYPPRPDEDHVWASGEVSLVSGETTLHDIVLVPMDG
jgi:hypothetical protein